MSRHLRAHISDRRRPVPRAKGTTASSSAPNLVARVYEYHLDVSRQWDRVDESATSGLERERTNALLLQLSAAGIIDRYEPRLRRDLSRTLKDLQDLQERRRVCYAGRDGPRDYSFRKTNPTNRFS